MADAPPPPNPDDDLKKKKQKDLDALLQQQTDLTKAIASLQAEIKALQTKIDEVTQATAGYDKSAADMQDQLDAGQALIVQKDNIAIAVIKDLKDAVDKRIADFDRALAQQAAAVTDASNKSEAAATDAAAAEAAAADKQAAFDRLKRTPKDLDAAFKDLTAVIAQITKAEAQNDFVGMYLLVGEAKTIADGIHVPSLKDYTAGIRAAQADADQAKAAAATKRATADQLAAAYAAARQAYDAAVKSRRTDLLNVLKAIKAKAA